MVASSNFFDNSHIKGEKNITQSHLLDAFYGQVDVGVMVQ
jgi:hypothetical protein